MPPRIGTDGNRRSVVVYQDGCQNIDPRNGVIHLLLNEVLNSGTPRQLLQQREVCGKIRHVLLTKSINTLAPR
ncbi:MAG: hypothetical protein LV473_06660 [Nitrospira sp.]|nr:hypothetical protein [Nitrospira sp.]